LEIEFKHQKKKMHRNDIYKKYIKHPYMVRFMQKKLKGKNLA